MKFATKLNKIPSQWIDLNLCEIKKMVLSNHGKIADGYALNMKHVPRKYAKELLKFLPIELHSMVTATAITDIKYALPHVHKNDKCVINFYKYTNDAPTIFWAGDIQYDISEDFGNGYFNCNTKYLTETERFYACSGDVWLLNTAAPHSLLKENNDKNRIAYQVYFNVPYETVLQILNK